MPPTAGEGGPGATAYAALRRRRLRIDQDDEEIARAVLAFLTVIR